MRVCVYLLHTTSLTLPFITLVLATSLQYIQADGQTDRQMDRYATNHVLANCDPSLTVIDLSLQSVEAAKARLVVEFGCPQETRVGKPGWTGEFFITILLR